MSEMRLIDANAQNEKIGKTVTNFARIIVCGTVEKPYYNILWYDPDDREYHIGYGSYELGFVNKWLKEEFEVVEFSNEPLVHGRWVHEQRYGDSGGWVWRCSVCRREAISPIISALKYCHSCGAKMDLKEEDK